MVSSSVKTFSSASENLSVDGTSTADSLSQLTIRKDTKYISKDPGTEAELKRAVRKLDLTILPIMTMFYFLSFLDRANIGNARVAGLQKSLNLTDHQYSICITVTYIPYILAEVPSNLLLRKIGPNVVMPLILTIWGVIVTLEGLVSSYGRLLVARAFLGLAEGPMFPGIVLYLSSFYTREELSFRIAFFFSAASLSGAFSGLLAAAISKLAGVGGKPAWAWIFILEGIFTVCVGLGTFWLVPQTPSHSKFLTERQKDIIVTRLEQDRKFADALSTFRFKYVLQSIKSPHVLILFMVYFMGGTNLFGLALFLPSIIKQLGNGPNQSQLLSVGPFAVGFIVTVYASWASDRMRTRVVPLCFILMISLVGYSMFLASPAKHVAYASLYLMVPGIYATAPVISAWVANNSEPHYTRATSIALGFVATSLGGVFSTWRYPTSEGPRFRKTTIMNLIFSLGMIVLALVNAAYLTYQNKQKKVNRAEILKPYADSKELDGGVQAWIDLGDRHPDFKYIV